MKSFIFALNATAVSAATFLGTTLDEIIFEPVHSQVTFDDDTWALTANYGSLELKKGEAKAYLLAVSFEIAGIDIPDTTALETYASIPDPDNAGMYETWTCKVNYTKPKY